MIISQNTHIRYGHIAMALHWSIALLFIILVVLGLTMINMEDGDDKWKLYSLHKSFGFMATFLILIRILWRLTNPAPLLPEGLKRYEVLLAHSVHIGLYVIMIIMPISGYIDSIAGGYKTQFFGLFDIPKLIEKDKNLAETAKNIHEFVSFALYGLFFIHFAAVLKHHFVMKDNTLRRMLPLKLK
jgi:cytochrome b561